VDEQEHPAGQEPAEPQQPAEPSAPGVTSPITAPVAGQPRPRRRGATVRRALASRGAGWVVAAVLAGAVVALSVVLATSASEQGVVVPFGAVEKHVVVGPGGPRFMPPGAVSIGAVPVGPGQVQVVGPGQVQVLAPGALKMVGPGGVVDWSSVSIGALPGAFAGTVPSPFGPVVVGTVGSVSSSSFTLTGGAQPVTVNEQSSTVYRQADSPVSASAVTSGERVAVLGTPNGTKISAIVVAVLSG
jgi:hypothetical protein